MVLHCCPATVFGVGRKFHPQTALEPSSFSQVWLPQLPAFCFSDSCFLSLLSLADFLMLNDSLYVQATYIAGEEVWRQDALGM